MGVRGWGLGVGDVVQASIGFNPGALPKQHGVPSCSLVFISTRGCKGLDDGPSHLMTPDDRTFLMYTVVLVDVLRLLGSVYRGLYRSVDLRAERTQHAYLSRILHDLLDW